MLKQTDHVSSHALSSDIVKAHAWLRDQRDERDERLDEQGADRTQSMQCLRSADGVFRAPLSVLVDRGEYVACDEDIEEEAADDLSDDEFLDFPEQDDYYARLADHLGIEEDQAEPTWLGIVRKDDTDLPPVSCPVATNHESNNPELRRMTDGKTVIRVWNRYLMRDRRSWKANTNHEKQHRRSA